MDTNENEYEIENFKVLDILYKEVDDFNRVYIDDYDNIRNDFFRNYDGNKNFNHILYMIRFSQEYDYSNLDKEKQEYISRQIMILDNYYAMIINMMILGIL